MSRIPWVIAGVLGLAATASLALNLHLQQRTVELEAQVDDLQQVQAARSSRSERGGKRSRRRARTGAPVEQGEARPSGRRWGGGGSSDSTDPIVIGEGEIEAQVDERVEARIDERRQQWRDERREHMEQALDDYAETSDLPEEQLEALDQVMSDGMARMGELFEARSNGDMDRDEAREQMRTVRDDIDDQVIELLGEEEGEAFLDSVRGGFGPGRGRR